MTVGRRVDFRAVFVSLALWWACAAAPCAAQTRMANPEALTGPPSPELPYGELHGPAGVERAPYPPHLPAPQGWRHDFPFIEFSHSAPNDPERSVGLGEPLEGTSWRNRPWHVGWFVGAINGDDLIESRVDQHTGLFGGYRLGYDFDHYWGAEARWGFANLPLADTNPLTADGRTSRDWFFDAHLLHYPWGDARWRPFVSLGLGWSQYYFVDDQIQRIKDTTVHLPLGAGVKYYLRPWLALRTELMDNISFSSEHVDVMHNLSWTCGAEMHFGGRRKSYFPWHTGLHPW